MKHKRARVVYSYAPQNDDELKLEVDEVIEVLDEVEEGWWKGKLHGQVGVFPSNFVVEISNSEMSQDNVKSEISDNDLSSLSNENVDGSKPSSLKRDGSLEKKPKQVRGVGFGDIFAGGMKPKLSPIDGDKNKNVPKKPPPPAPVGDSSESAPKLPPKPSREQAKVLYAYEAQNEDELSIKEGDTINIISKEIEDQGWWKGELNGRIGVFPDNFVELIKIPEEGNSLRGLKKPERPVEKPPSTGAAAVLSQSKSAQSKLSESKILNKSLDELPKNTVGLGQQNNSVPVPGKKPKVATPQQQKTKSESGSGSFNAKPDVVPQENGNKLENDSLTSITNNETNFANIDPSVNRLTHLTANRSKGPTRRPPSTIYMPKEPDSETKENGNAAKADLLAHTTSQPSPQTEQAHPVNKAHEKPHQQTTPDKPPEKLPPWMVELRKAQERRKENNEDLPKEVNKVQIVGSPTKNNRFSGEFKSLMQPSSPSETTEANNFNNPVQLLKPLKSVSAKVSSSGSPPSQVGTTISISNSTNNVTSATSTTTKTSTVVISSATNSVSSNQEDTAINKDKEIAMLQKEIKSLQETAVTRKEHNELLKQVSDYLDAKYCLFFVLE